MQDDFELETVLSVTTGINLTDDFSKVFDLFCFMFEDDLLNVTALISLRETAKKHILNIHPELRRVSYNQNVNLEKWIANQKEMFGDSITISILNEPVISLKKQPLVSTR